ncbi:50S ribosomal protein L24 [Buchnera aphidicola (Kurisakia onigurumii)]|uniref:50S ribosomal protein L24 n=1 Tax=Buchnera aphidicola TaxID=9 RepID=UPI0031B69CD5
MASKIRKNDQVLVISGKDKGKKGIVLHILKKSKAIVSGINIVKKHQKSVPAQNKIGGIIKKESPISISNIGIFNKETKRSDRIGFKFENGKKIRFFKSNNKIIE